MSRYSNQAIYFVFLKNDNVCNAGQNECGIAQPMCCKEVTLVGENELRVIFRPQGIGNAESHHGKNKSYHGPR